MFHVFHGISSEVLPKKFSPNWGGGGGGGGKGKGWGSAVIGMKALKRRAHLSGDLVIFCRLFTYYAMKRQHYQTKKMEVAI